jgi:hypothetical protein
MLQAAAEAAGDQHYPQGALYVVATPIGNLADISLRAVHVLALVDAIACEDTRHSAPLLRRLGLDKPLIALHQHNERTAAAAVLERLARGERVACISDAGTPAISDPGAELVAAARAAGIPHGPDSRREQRGRRAQHQRRCARQRLPVRRFPAVARQGARECHRAAGRRSAPARSCSKRRIGSKTSRTAWPAARPPARSRCAAN